MVPLILSILAVLLSGVASIFGFLSYKNSKAARNDSKEALELMQKSRGQLKQMIQILDNITGTPSGIM